MSKKEQNIKDTASDIDDTMVNYYAEWSYQHENILVEWADKAICYRWLHSMSHNSYASKTRWFTIPVIIMSTLTGTANFALERVPQEYVPYYSIGIGAVNIIAGIITTIQQFLKINELNEAHRVTSIAWDKFYRNIKLELAKSRNERMHAYQMLKISKEEFDRLMETSPSINPKIIKLFYKTFSGGNIKKDKELNDKQKTFDEMFKPEICNYLQSTRHAVYKEHPTEPSKTAKMSNAINIVKENNIIEKNKKYNENYNKVDEFIIDFSKEYNRKPSKIEIEDNLSDSIPYDTFNKIIKEFELHN